MRHVYLFWGTSTSHLQLMIVAYILSLIMILAIAVNIERAKGNGSRRLLRLLIWPLAVVTIADLIVAEARYQHLDLMDVFIYAGWFKVVCLIIFWGLVHA